MFYPRTINVIQGQAGTHKSRVAEHFCSALIKRSGYILELLGLEAKEINYTVVHVDTERNISEQYPYCLQQIIINAGYKKEEDIPNFDFISLIDIPRSERFEAFREYLDKIRETYEGHIFVVLDVITDLVENFNDPKESLKLIDLLNSTINNYDITFLCIIHENPSQIKARGHLGTELFNKSSTTLSINFEKDNKGNDLDIIKIRSLKCRSSKKLEPLYLKFVENGFKLVFAEDYEIENAIQSRAKKAKIFDVADYLVENFKGRTSKSKLIETLSQEFDCSTRTIEERIKDMLKGKGLSALGYSLKKVKMGIEKFFELKKVIPENKQENLFQ